MEWSSCLADPAQERPVASDAVAPGQDEPSATKWGSSAVGPLQQSSSPANTADTDVGDGPAQRCRMRFYFTEVKHKINQAPRKAPAGFQNK